MRPLYPFNFFLKDCTKCLRNFIFNQNLHQVTIQNITNIKHHKYKTNNELKCKQPFQIEFVGLT